MGRRRLKIGEHGEISCTWRGTAWRAIARTRDRDGEVRQVSASGPSKEAARRTLMRDLVERHSAAARIEAGTDADRDAGIDVDGLTPDTTVAALADQWITECGLRGLRSQTLRIYQDSVRLHIKPAMGHWLVREATTGAVDRVLKQHRANGRDSSALRKHLNQMFALAVRHDALVANPVTNVTKVQKKAQKVRVLEEIALVAEIRGHINRWETEKRPGPKATPDLGDLILLLIATGARPGELLALRWQDINLLAARPYLRITGTIIQEKGKGTYRQDEPKSPKSTRPLEIPPTVVAMLMDRNLAQGDNPIDAVFPSRVGTWTPYSTLRRRWEDAIGGTEYGWVTFKTFRKQVATLIARQLGARVAMEQLGHASEATTETYYIAQNVDAPKVSELIEQFIKDSAPPEDPPTQHTHRAA